MNWVQLQLRGRVTLPFVGDKQCFARLAGNELGSPDRRDLVVETGLYQATTLSRVVDTDQALAMPRVLVIQGSEPSELFLFGGEMAYWLTSDGKIAGEAPTYRDYRIDDLWSLEIIPFGENLIVVYETGLLVINEALELKWQRRKYIGEHLHLVNDDKVQLVDEGPHGDQFVTFRFSNGDVLSAPANWRPGEPPDNSTSKK